MKLFKLLLLLTLTLTLSEVSYAQVGLNDDTYSEQRENYNYSKEQPEKAQDEKKPQTSNLTETRETTPWTGWKSILTVLGVVLLAAFVIIMLYNVQQRNDSKATRELVAAKSLKHAEEDLLEVSLDDLISNASEDGDHRMLVHLHYLSLLKALHDQGHIQWKPFKTNGQYAFEISTPNIRDQYAELTRVFDRVWYGHKVISNQELEIWRSSLKNLIKT